MATEDSVNGTTPVETEAQPGGIAAETMSRPASFSGSDSGGDGKRPPPRETPPRDPQRDLYREALRERLREPLRDMFRDPSLPPSNPGQGSGTPAARFAPAAPPPGPQTVVVRQPWLIMLIVVIAVLGVAGAVLLGWQLRLLQGQMAHLATTVTQENRIVDSVSRLSDAATQANEIANQALVTSTRPWIGVDTVETSPVVAGQPLNIEVRVRNSGRTPSIDMQGLFLVYISPVDNPPAPLTDQCASCVRSVVLPNGIVTYHLAVRDSVMTPAEIQRIKDGKDTMWIVGRLDYHDGEGELHTTSSCLFYRAKGIASFTACNDGNSAS